MIKRMIITLALITFGGSVGNAAESMSLDDAIKIALQNNPQISAQDENVQGRLMEEKVSFGNMLPRVDLKYGYQRVDEAPSMSLPPVIIPPSTTSLLPEEIPTGFKNTYSFSVSATQTLFAGGALYNAYKVAGNTYQATSIGRGQSVRDLKRQVIEGYYGLIQARQTLEVARSAAASIKSHLDVAGAFFGQGMIPKNDLLEAEVRYAQSQQNVIQAENACRIAESNLNQLLGRDLSIPVSLDKEIPMAEMKGSLDESIQTGLSERQEIRITQLQIDSADKGIRISKAGYMPSVAASYTYMKVGEHTDVDYEDSWTAGLGLTWNIFQGGSTYYGVSRATADRNRLTYMLQAQKNMVGFEVKNAYLSAEEAKARITVAAKAIDQAQENLRIQKDRYNLQVATTTNVLDAESLLDQSQMNFITARADYARALAALQAAMGSL